MRIITIVILSLLMGQTHAQYTYWEHVIGGEGDLGEGYNNVVTFQDEIVAFVINHGADDNLILRKYNLDGELIMENGITYPYNGFYVTGLTKSFQQLPNNEGYMHVGTSSIGSQDDGYVMRIDNNLDTLWCQFYDMSTTETTVLNRLMIRDNSVIILGFSSAYSNGHENTFLLEMDFDGNVLLFNTMQPTDVVNDYRNYSIIEVDNGYIIGGVRSEYIVSSDFTLFKALITKVDFEGNTMWELLGEDPPEGIGEAGGLIDVQQMNNGDILVTYGQSYEHFEGGFNYEFWTKQKLFKIEDNGSSGSFAWNKNVLLIMKC